MPFPDLADRLAEVRARVDDARRRGGHGQTVTVVGVTKTYGPEAPLAAWGAGVRDVGENKVQEALAKIPRVEVPLRWHLIGHLQRNKVKQIDPFTLIHSMDSARLADALAAHGAARGRPVEVLAQVNVSAEETKGGYQPSMFVQEADRLRGLSGIVVRGVMTRSPWKKALPWSALEPCCSEREPPNGRDLPSHSARRAALRFRPQVARVRPRARRAVPAPGRGGARAADAPDPGARGQGQGVPRAASGLSGA